MAVSIHERNVQILATDTLGTILKNGPSKICGRQPLKNLKFFKGYLPQILLGPFLNTLFHL